MKLNVLTLLGATVLLSVACHKTEETVEVDGVAEHGVEQKEEDDCAKESKTTELTQENAEERKGENGVAYVHIGAELAQTELTTVEAMLADPKAYEGKAVRVEGDVSAMCKHRRGWFSVVAGDKSGQSLRVLAAPAFLVPPESVGKLARAEGVVELVEMSKKHSEHITGEHGIELPGTEEEGKVYQPVLRATGAEFQ